MGLHRITLAVITVMVVLVLVACQESGEEDVYLDKMWAWHSLEGFAFSLEREEAMLAELEAIEPPRVWYGEHLSLTATYRAYLSAERTEDLLQESEKRRFRAWGSYDLPGCDHLRYRVPPLSLEYRAACETRFAASGAWIAQSTMWNIDYLQDRTLAYRLWEDAATLSRAMSIEENAAAIIDELTQIARKHR